MKKTILLFAFIITVFFSVNQKQQSEKELNLQIQLNQEEVDQQVKRRKLQSLKNENKWACINGLDPSTLTPQEQLLEFAKGPCSPVILLPGVMATSLVVQIDCPTLQQENPGIFASCGWETCSSLEFWKKAPNPEYTVWIGELFGPQTILQLTQQSSCWGNLIGLNFDQKSQEWKHPAGIYVTWKGNTEETLSQSKCGNLAVQDISLSKVLASCQTVLYKNFVSHLDALGYQYGVTYQSIPYDFRFGVNEGNTTQIINTTLKNLNKFTGKRTVIVGHSLGTIHAYTAIARMEQEDKDRLIKMFMTIAPPFLGSIQTISDHLAGNLEYTKKIFSKLIGIDYINQKQFIHSSASSIFNLYGRDAFYRFREEPWMQEVRQRIEYEQNFQKYKYVNRADVPLNILPLPNETCYLHHNCSSGLIDLSTDCYAKVAGKVYHCNNDGWKQFFSDQCFQGDAQELTYMKSIIQELDNLQNPNVPTVIVYSSIFNVSKNFDFYVDQLDYANNQTFGLFNKTEFSIGDGTVLSTSVLAPAFKWIWEFKNKDKLNNPNFKPIKLVQYCSSQNQKSQVYDITNDNGEREITEIGYQGIDCQCKKESQKDECAHSCIVNDESLIPLLQDAIMTYEKSQNINDIINYFNDDFITNWQFNCPNLRDFQ